MEFIDKLKLITEKNRSFLCIGLDIDPDKIPNRFLSIQNNIYHYACKIIDETKDLVCAYKPNTAFYEAYGQEGISQLKKIIEYIPKEIPVILDFKRGDIGNTAAQYAHSAYEYFKADAVTLSPYMGQEAIAPFLKFSKKFVFILVRTSNSSSDEIQLQKLENGNFIYEQIAQSATKWANEKKIGFVVGATQPDELINLRKKFPERIFLIPGIGSQGGAVETTIQHGKDKAKQLAVVNVSRKIIYPEEEKTIREIAQHFHRQLSDFK